MNDQDRQARTTELTVCCFRVLRFCLDRDQDAANTVFDEVNTTYGSTGVVQLLHALTLTTADIGGLRASTASIRAQLDADPQRLLSEMFLYQPETGEKSPLGARGEKAMLQALEFLCLCVDGPRQAMLDMFNDAYYNPDPDVVVDLITGTMMLAVAVIFALPAPLVEKLKEFDPNQITEKYLSAQEGATS